LLAIVDPDLDATGITRLGRARTLHATTKWRVRVVLAALATAWMTQAPELIEKLLRLAATDGWTSALPY
jgi:hypothetical protein